MMWDVENENNAGDTEMLPTGPTGLLRITLWGIVQPWACQDFSYRNRKKVGNSRGMSLTFSFGISHHWYVQLRGISDYEALSVHRWQGGWDLKNMKWTDCWDVQSLELSSMSSHNVWHLRIYVWITAEKVDLLSGLRWILFLCFWIFE